MFLFKLQTKIKKQTKNKQKINFMKLENICNTSETRTLGPVITISQTNPGALPIRQRGFSFKFYMNTKGLLLVDLEIVSCDELFVLAYRASYSSLLLKTA